MSVLDKVLQMRRQREESAEAAFRRIVDQLAADGKKVPTPEEIDRALIDTGRTIEDLEAAVKRATRRRELRAQISEAEKAIATRGELEQQIAAADKVLEAAKAKHHGAVAPLRQQIDNINQALSLAQAAKRELRESIAEEDAAAIAEAGREVERSRQARDAARKHLEAMQARNPARDADSRDDWRATSAGQVTNANEYAEWQGMVQRAEQRLQEAQKAADDAVSRSDELVATAMAS